MTDQMNLCVRNMTAVMEGGNVMGTDVLYLNSCVMILWTAKTDQMKRIVRIEVVLTKSGDVEMRPNASKIITCVMETWTVMMNQTSSIVGNMIVAKDGGSVKMESRVFLKTKCVMVTEKTAKIFQMRMSVKIGLVQMTAGSVITTYVSIPYIYAMVKRNVMTIQMRNVGMRIS